MTQQSHSCGYTQKNGTQVIPEACTAMFIAVLFTIAKLWKQPRCPTTNGLRNVVLIHNVVLLSHEEE
jgi:hypothetical protein